MFKVGDKVWSFTQGWGTVKKIDADASFPVCYVPLGKEEAEGVWYTEDGREFETDNRTLFFEELMIPQSALERKIKEDSVPHIERMKKELKELKSKIKAGSDFYQEELENKKFTDEVQRATLMVQLAYMENYVTTLEYRIAYDIKKYITGGMQ